MPTAKVCTVFIRTLVIETHIHSNQWAWLIPPNGPSILRPQLKIYSVEVSTCRRSTTPSSWSLERPHSCTLFLIEEKTPPKDLGKSTSSRTGRKVKTYGCSRGAETTRPVPILSWIAPQQERWAGRSLAQWWRTLTKPTFRFYKTLDVN